MIFAEATNSEIGSFVNVVSILIGIVGGSFAIYFGFRKKSFEIEKQPIETRRAAKRYNHDLTEQRFGDHERRIVSLEEWQAELNNKLEQNKTEIMEAANEGREKLHKRINNQSRMLYLIAGKLGVNVSRDGEDEE